MDVNKILELETRRKIYNYILEYPGLHFRELSRKMKIPKSTLKYHLKYLKKRELIVETYSDKYSRYYVSKKVGNDTKKILEIIRQDSLRRIILSMKIPNIVTLEYLTHELDRSPSTISHHLKKLIDEDIVERVKVKNQVNFRLKNEQKLYDVFIQYNKSLLDELVGALVDWITQIRTDPSFYDLIHHIQDTEAVIRGLYLMFPHPYHA